MPNCSRTTAGVESQLTEQEITQLLAELEKLLSDLGLDFIVAQERVLAAEGVSQSPAEARDRRGQGVDPQQPDETLVLETTILSESREASSWERSRPSTQKLRFKSSDAVVTPLDLRARLAILLDLVEVATAGTLAMERDVQDRLDELRRQASDLSTSDMELFAATRPDYTGKTDEWDGAVTFSDPPEAELRGQVLPPWKLATADVLQENTSRVRTVLGLLQELRAQAGLSRGQWLAPHDGDSVNDGGWNLPRRRYERG